PYPPLSRSPRQEEAGSPAGPPADGSRGDEEVAPAGRHGRDGDGYDRCTSDARAHVVLQTMRRNGVADTWSDARERSGVGNRVDQVTRSRENRRLDHLIIFGPYGENDQVATAGVSAASRSPDRHARDEIGRAHV